MREELVLDVLGDGFSSAARRERHAAHNHVNTGARRVVGLYLSVC